MMLVSVIRSQFAILVITFRWVWVKLTYCIVSARKSGQWSYISLSSSLKILMEDYITAGLKILFKVVMQKKKKKSL